MTACSRSCAHSGGLSAGRSRSRRTSEAFTLARSRRPGAAQVTASGHCRCHSARKLRCAMFGAKLWLHAARRTRRDTAAFHLCLSRAAPRRRTAYAHRPAADLCCDEQADELPSDNVSRATYRAEAPEFKISATMSAPPQLPCQLEPPPRPHSNPWLPLLIDRLHRLPPTAL